MWGALYYGLGWLVLLAYIPLDMWRKYTDRAAVPIAEPAAAAVAPVETSVWDAPEH